MGYFKIPDWFVDGSMKDVSNVELRVLLFLMRVSNKKGKSFYSQGKIAKAIGMSQRSVIRAVGELEKNGWIKCKRREGSSTFYSIHERFGEDVICAKRVTPLLPWLS